jgi:hypothetical protein
MSKTRKRCKMRKTRKRCKMRKTRKRCKMNKKDKQVTWPNCSGKFQLFSLYDCNVGVGYIVFKFGMFVDVQDVENH